MLSLYSMAAFVRTETEIKGNADPYTCEMQAELKAKYRKNGQPAKYIRYYRYYRCETVDEIVEARNKTSYTVDVIYPLDVFIVASGNTLLPPTHGSTSDDDEEDTRDIPDKCLPVTDIDVLQFDIYYVTKGTPMVEHVVKLRANMFTKKAEYQLFSTVGGQDEEGNGYCYKGPWDTYLMYNSDHTQLIESTKKNPLTGEGILSLSPSNKEYVYDVFAGSVRVMAPAKDFVPEPSDQRYSFNWLDRFRITVLQPECMPNLVYRKWDNLMFVDNGKNGGDGRFVRYQWYKDRDPIEGATKQWYRFEDIPSIERYLFYAECFFEDGSSIFTCPTKFEDLPASTDYNSHGYIGAPAHKELQNGQLIIELDGVKYNAQGMKIQ